MKNISIDCTSVSGKNTGFWKAAGLDSLFALVMSDSGSRLMAEMNKFDTCRYVRNHFTLSEHYIDGVRAGGNVYSENENGEAVYDFTYINAVFRRCIENGLKPMVEYDFLPNELITCEAGSVAQEGTDISLRGRLWPSDWEKWEMLLRAFTENLASEFGLEEIRTWYFEVWNEPDSWKTEDHEKFYRMYDLFAECVKSTDKSLRVGGPGAFTPAFMRGFLNHVAQGTNYITGEKGAPIDFISYHIYGMSGGWLDAYPLIMPTVQRFTQQIMWMQRMIAEYPSLKNAEFHINEWGVISNYEKSSADYPPLYVRDSEFSALFFIKLADCIYKIRESFGFEVKMLLYWGFSEEDEKGLLFNGNRSLSTGFGIAKPIETAHEMLSRLGDDMLTVSGAATGSSSSVIAAKDAYSYQALAYFFDENEPENIGRSKDMLITFNNMTNGKYCLRRYIIDRNHNNSFRLWQALGSNKHPDYNEMKLLKAEGALDFSGEEYVTVTDGKYEREINLQLNSCVLFDFIRITD